MGVKKGCAMHGVTATRRQVIGELSKGDLREGEVDLLRHEYFVQPDEVPGSGNTRGYLQSQSAEEPAKED